MRRCQKLPPCWKQPMSASSKMDPLLAKAEPISKAGDTPVVTCLTECKKHCTTAAVGEE